MITTLYFVNGPFGFIRKHTELERLIGEVRELAHDYRLQSVEVRITTDRRAPDEYGEDEG